MATNEMVNAKVKRNRRRMCAKIFRVTKPLPLESV
jgi:hypothetical protein